MKTIHNNSGGSNLPVGLMPPSSSTAFRYNIRALCRYLLVDRLGQMRFIQVVLGRYRHAEILEKVLTVFGSHLSSHRPHSNSRSYKDYPNRECHALS